MERTKRDLIKLLTVAIAVCFSLFAFMLPKTQAKAETHSTVAVFELVKDASIRLPSDVDEVLDGEEKRYKGLRFSTQVNDLWFDQNQANEYVFGTLIFPEKNGSVNTKWSEYDNVKELKAVRIVADTQDVISNGNYTASIVYDHTMVKNLAISAGLIDANDYEIDEKTKMLLDGLYSLRLTAVSYVKKDGVITYTDPYTTSIVEVSVRLLSNPDWVSRVSEYVTLESVVDDGYVLVEDGRLHKFIARDVKQVFINGEIAEYQIDGESIILPSLISSAVGKEYEIAILDNLNNAVIVSAVTADVAISSAEEFMSIFDSGDYNASNTYPIENSKYYVLADDINLENYLIDNTADANAISLTGTLNGLGHTVLNATVDMTKSGGKATQGIFGNITGTITNVGFVNLKGTASAGADVGLTAPLAKNLSGTLDNVYIGLSAFNYNARGPISTYSSSAVIKDVILNFPQVEGYVFDDEMYKTVSMSTTTYAYGYGSLGYYVSGLNPSNIENFYIISPMPINYSFGAGGSAYYDSTLLNSDYFFYGENETDVWFNYSYFKANGITNPTVENTKGNLGASKTVVLENVRRYDSIEDMTSDVSSKNLANVQKFLSNSGWKQGANGDVLWNSQKETVVIDRAVDYDAYNGELITTLIDTSEIIRVSVGSEELTRTNGGLKLTNGVYTLRAKTSASDAQPGVPYVNTFTNVSNVIKMKIETSDNIYEFTNVYYYTNVISNADELKSALDITYSLDNLFNYGFYKMDADIDFAGHSFTYTGLDSKTLFNNASKFNQYHEFGFAGQFDGCGHKISNIANNATSRGLFTNFVRGGASNPKAPVFVKNLAVINFTNNTAPVLALFANNFVTEIENIYVTYNYNAVPNGLINMPCGKFAKINNVLVAGSQTYRTPYTNYSWNVNMPIKSGAQYGDVSGIATGSTDDFYTVATLFNTLRWATPETVDAVTNVITVGHSPVAYQGAGISPKYAHQFKATDNGNGTYTHNLMNYGYPGNPYYPEDYIGYAGNDKVGNVLKITGINPAFAELASTSNGSALAGFYCATCYKTFSKEAGTCACGAELTQSANLWEVAGAYAYGVTDLTNYVNPDNTANNGEMVFYGVNRYNKVSELKSAFLADNSIYDSFIGEAGQDMWGITSDGELIWKSLIDNNVTIKVDGEETSDVNAKVGDVKNIELFDGDSSVAINSIISSSDAVTVDGTNIIASKTGFAEIKVSYSVNGVEFTEIIYVNVDHDYGEYIESVPPTCTENGTKGHYECSCCGKYFDGNYVEITDITVNGSHNYSDWVSNGDGIHYRVCKNDNTHIVVELCLGNLATCTEDGVCDTCNGVIEDALGHTGGTATCDEWGKCSRCQKDYIEPIGHNYSLQIITDEYLVSEATCVNKPVYYLVCANCSGTNDSYIFEYGNALGHTGGEANCMYPAICSRCSTPYGELSDHVYQAKSDDEYHWQECKGCSKVIEKYAHSFDAGKVTQAPSCVELGVTTYTCDCGYKKYQEIAMLSHNLGAFNDEIPSTCEQNGTKAHYQCSSCLQYFDEDEDLIKDITLPKAHVFKKYNQPIEPTCDVEGRIGFYHCEVCGKFFEFNQVTELSESDLAVPATEHTDVSTGRCPCGEVYASDEFFLQYMEFIEVGYKLPDKKDSDGYTWGYKLNRFFSDLPGAPVHVKIPSTYKGRKVYAISDFVFDVTSSRASNCDVGASDYHKNCTNDYCERLYYYRTTEDGTQTSPTDGNPYGKPIQSIIIPEGIMFIGDYAFGNAEIKELVIPNSVIGGFAKKKSNVPVGAIYNRDIYEYELRNICTGCNLLEKVVIGSGVDVIGSYCFYGLKSLREVKFVVEEVDNGDGTTRLEGVREIRTRAFDSADVTVDPTQPDLSTPKFVIPETLVSLPEGSIYHASTDQNVRLYKLHSQNMKYYLNITEEEYNALVIPAKERDGKGWFVNEEDNTPTTYGYTEGWCGSSVLYFKGEWFYNSEGNPMAYEEVTEMETPYDYSDGTYLITNDGAIVGLTDSGKKLATVNVPLTINGVTITRIAPNAFKYSNATNVVLSQNITVIDSYAFRKMYNLTSVVATTNVKRIGDDIFRESKNVNSLTINSLVSNVSSVVISGSAKISSICEKIGDSTITIRAGKFIVTNSETSYVLDSNGFIVNSENVLVGYLGSAKEVTLSSSIVEIGEGAFENSHVNVVNLPSGLVKIGNNAFRNSNIISIALPDGVTEIGEGAFAHTNIKEFTLPSGVTKIESNAFAGCKLLSKFIFNDVVTEIGDGAFTGCSKIKEINLPSTVTRIGDYAFLSCDKLAKVFIPRSTKYIGAYAFTNCNNIEAFEYEGTRADWNLMDIHRYWNNASSEFDVIFADGVGEYLDVQDTINLVINSSVTIKHNLNGILFWSSSNEDVATVDQNGRVTAIDIGTAIITVQMGRNYGKCTVNVTYGDMLPKFVTENGIQDGDLLEKGKIYNLYTHVLFNYKEFYDFSLTCVSSDSSVASVVYNQNSKAIVISALTTGKASITVIANWRDFKGYDVLSLTETFSFDVIGDVDFFVNGDLPHNIDILAPNDFSNEGDNIAPFVPTVVIDGVTYTPTVTVDYLNGANGRFVKYDKANARFIGYKVSKAKVMLRYTHNDIVMGTDLIVSVIPNDITLSDTYLFSADDGKFMIKNANDAYEEVTISDFLGETVNSATCDGEQLFVDGDYSIYGVNYKPYEYHYTTIEVLTATSRYVIPVQVAKRYIDSGDDLLEVLNVKVNVADDGTTVEGPYALVADLDMTGLYAYNFANGHGADTRGLDSFNGMLDGCGHTISNLTINMYMKDCNNQGLFGVISSSAIIKNVAFVNFLGKSTRDVGLTSPFAYRLLGTLENVYIEMSSETCNNRGAINQIASGATLKNVIFSFKEGVEFDYASVSVDTTWKAAYGYGSLAQSVSASANYNNVCVISSLPLFYDTSAGGQDRYDMKSHTTDYFVYGENETEFWFNHTVNAGKTFDEVIVDYASSTASKARRLSNVRRYDSISDMMLDTSSKNVANVNTFVSTGYWSVVDGTFAWN